jgi:hypothetical protein
MNFTNEIIYPFFLSCVQYCGQDKELENLFEALSMGRPVRGCVMEGDTIKGKGFTYKITTKDPEKLYTDIATLFPSEAPVQKEEKKYAKWGDIRKKAVKRILLERYIINSKFEDPGEVYKKYMRLYLTNSNSHNIILENGEIVDIIDNKRADYSSDSSTEEPLISNAPKSTREAWKKYIDQFNKL